MMKYKYFWGTHDDGNLSCLTWSIMTGYSLPLLYSRNSTCLVICSTKVSSLPRSSDRPTNWSNVPTFRSGMWNFQFEDSCCLEVTWNHASILVIVKQYIYHWVSLDWAYRKFVDMFSHQGLILASTQKSWSEKIKILSILSKSWTSLSLIFILA